MVTNENEFEKKEINTTSKDEIRNIVGFWLLGLTNDFVFTVMISAAHDLLTPERLSKDDNLNRTSFLLKNCNPIGTGVILLADTLPEVIVKISAPLFIYYLAYRFKVGFTILLIQMGIILVSIFGNRIVWLTIIGVSIGSAGTGLGEVVFLGLSSFYNRNCVSSWCSGTGAAGLAGALLYAGFTACGISPKSSIMLMTFGPVFMIGSYIMLVTPREIEREGIILASYTVTSDRSNEDEDDDEKRCVINPPMDKSSIAKELTCKEKIILFKSLAHLIVWFASTYFVLFLTNQVLFEIIVFENIWLGTSQQYRWYQVICQIGIFIARSSVNVVYTSKTWIFFVIELLIFLILLSSIFGQYITNIFVIFVLIFIEGLAAGASYVNTYYSVTLTVDQKNLECAMVFACVADSVGTVLAGAIAIPVHNLICSL